MTMDYMTEWNFLHDNNMVGSRIKEMIVGLGEFKEVGAPTVLMTPSYIHTDIMLRTCVTCLRRQTFEMIKGMI